MAKSTSFELSAVDRRILRALQEDGRMTVQAIAEKVGLSASPCLRRIRQLEQAGVIGQRALEGRFISFAENLFNDRAVVMPTAHAGSYRPQTEAIAMSAGWRWSIPLTTRTGNGYVYSSAHISDEDAEAELRAACGSQASSKWSVSTKLPSLALIVSTL